jgi:hypothetical protein
MGKERIALEHQPDVALRCRNIGDVTAADQHPPGCWLHDTGQQGQRSGFARPARTEQGRKFPRLHVQRNVAQRPNGAELFGDADKFDGSHLTK